MLFYEIMIEFLDKVLLLQSLSVVNSMDLSLPKRLIICNQTQRCTVELFFKVHKNAASYHFYLGNSMIKDLFLLVEIS